MKGSPAIGTRLLNWLELKHQSRFGLDCLNDHSIAEDLSRLLVERTSRGVEAFNCTSEVRPHGRGYVLPAYGLTRRSASWFLLFFEEQELTLGLVLFSHLGEETGVLVAGLGVACVQPDRFLK